jgi:hypothetical protein
VIFGLNSITFLYMFCGALFSGCIFPAIICIMCVLFLTGFSVYSIFHSIRSTRVYNGTFLHDISHLNNMCRLQKNFSDTVRS